MPSNNAIEQIRARLKDQVVLMLITISPKDKPVIRIVNNTVAVTSNGNVFSPMHVNVDFSADDGVTLQVVNLTIENVSLEMIEWVRDTTEPAPVILQTVFSGDTDTVERQISDIVIRQSKYDSLQLVCSLMADDDLNQIVPSDTYDSYHYAGLF